jgi:eukaryotic-like serine/threonine-protein kinase
MTNPRSRLSIDPQGDVLVLKGAIDESAKMTDLLAHVRDQRLALDLGGITFINSLGVRDWIRLQTEAKAKGITVELRRVSEPLVHQLNMIVATRGAARVTSFFAPYACDKCGREDSLLIDAVAHARGLSQLEPPAMTCAECGAQMVFNDFPERYFLFLSV